MGGPGNEMKEWHSMKFQFWRSTPPAVMHKQTRKLVGRLDDLGAFLHPGLRVSVQRKLVEEQKGDGSLDTWHSCSTHGWMTQEAALNCWEMVRGFDENRKQYLKSKYLGETGSPCT